MPKSDFKLLDSFRNIVSMQLNLIGIDSINLFMNVVSSSSSQFAVKEAIYFFKFKVKIDEKFHKALLPIETYKELCCLLIYN